MDTNCLVCREITGVIAVPGGALHTSTNSLVVHVPPIDGDDVYLGHLLAVPRRHVADFAGLDVAVDELNHKNASSSGIFPAS